VRLRDRRHDRQTETDAAFRAGARRVGAREALEDLTDAVRRDAASPVPNVDDEHAVLGAGGQFDLRVRRGVLDRVLQERVERLAQRLRIRLQLAARERTQPPRPWRHLRPAQEDVLEERLDVDRLGNDEVRLVRCGQPKQPVDDALDAVELVERNRDLRRVLGEDLEMAARDGHGSAQLVRRVVHEALLPREQRRALVREDLDRLQRLLPAPGVPDHRQEHRAHQRDFRQLAPVLRVGLGVAQDWQSGERADAAEHDEGRR
jgi:hypothetical protein